MTISVGHIYQLLEPVCDCTLGLVLKERDRWGRRAVLPLSESADAAFPSIETAIGTRFALLDAVTPLMDTMLAEKRGELGQIEMESIFRALILTGVDHHFRYAHGKASFVPGRDPVPVSGRCYEAGDVRSLVDASLDFWLTAGRYNNQFEERLAKYLGVKHLLSVNSGSSANLLAFAALTSHRLGDKAIKPGDEVITVAAGFPTTVNPALQYGMVPVFVDVDPSTYNALPDRVAAAVTPRTRVIMLAHTLGNPFELDQIAGIAEQHDLWLIEDCCDALGSRYRDRLVGTFGHLATFSFYPAHHITMGEGGAVATNDPTLKQVVESLRDWGRDCWCNPGRDNTCRKRFDWQHGDLPEGYDHKYVYSHVGYNLKITDMQAAVGCAQLNHLPEFIGRRKENFRQLYEGLTSLGKYLSLPVAGSKADPSWFGFPLTLKQGDRNALLSYLDEKKIGVRLLFGGNLTRQPYFKNQRYRVAGELVNTDRIMTHGLWLGVYPGLSSEQIDYVVSSLHGYYSASG